jgi:hypothetical protein
MYRTYSESYDSLITAVNDPVTGYVSFGRTGPEETEAMKKNLSEFYTNLFNKNSRGNNP